MTLALALGLVAGGLLFGWSVWLYRRREPRVAATPWLTLMRGGVLLLVVILLVDPGLPGALQQRPVLLVDATASMMAAVEGAETAQARAASRADAAGARVRVVEAGGSLDAALAGELEAGASRVTLLTDTRLPESVALRALIDDAPVPVEIEDVGAGVRNAGVRELRLPGPERVGESSEVVVALGWEGSEPAALELQIEVDGETVADSTLAVGGGRGGREVRLELPAPETEGSQVVTARVAMAGDGFARDDRRSVLREVDPDRGAIVVVAWTPGWESRFLTSTLAEVAGLPVSGFLHTGGGSEGTGWMRGGERPARVESDVVQRAVEDAALVVAIGEVSGADSALVRAVARSERAIRFPDPGTLDDGEWLLDSELPLSPLSGELASLRLLGLPPLRSVRAEVADDAGETTLRQIPLRIGRGRDGESRPALELLQGEDGRSVAVKAAGFWRWALRPGEPAELYRRLWSAVVGWTLSGEGPETGGAIAPLRPVDLPGTPVEWSAPPAAGERLVVEWFDDDEPVGADTVQVDGAGMGSSPSLDAGRWRWRATVDGGEDADRVREGVIVREEWTGDLLHPRIHDLGEASSERDVRIAATRSLRSGPLPWILLLLLLASEWVLRRRAGLR